jgi:lycopene beta-cyclase
VSTGCAAVEVGAREVRLADGRRLAASLVVDARGPGGPERGAGYQKFVGHELELARPHGLTRPIVMDAEVPQIDGFRFFYVLPLGARRVLVEDTRFADGPDLDLGALRAEIAGYAERAGLEVAAVVREETGVLPMPWRGRGPRPTGSPLGAGYAGGFMHPATGYSFPIAARLAALLGQVGPGACFGPELARLARRQRGQTRFARLLNRLLFRWFRPDRRTDVFARFYRLPEARIRRFYALETTWTDRARLLVGRPPRGFSLRARLRHEERTHEPVSL